MYSFSFLFVIFVFWLVANMKSRHTHSLHTYTWVSYSSVVRESQTTRNFDETNVLICYFINNGHGHLQWLDCGNIYGIPNSAITTPYQNHITFMNWPVKDTVVLVKYIPQIYTHLFETWHLAKLGYHSFLINIWAWLYPWELITRSRYFICVSLEWESDRLIIDFLTTTLLLYRWEKKAQNSKRVQGSMFSGKCPYVLYIHTIRMTSFKGSWYGHDVMTQN